MSKSGLQNCLKRLYYLNKSGGMVSSLFGNSEGCPIMLVSVFFALFHGGKCEPLLTLKIQVRKVQIRTNK